MEQIIDWILSNSSSLLTTGKLILDIIFYSIALARIIVKLTPTPKDDTVLARVVEILKKIALYPKEG